MFIEDIKHKRTLQSIQDNNVDISKFDTLEALRKHLRALCFKKYHSKNRIEYNKKIREYYKAKMPSLNGMTKRDLRFFKKRLEKLIAKQRLDIRLRPI
jgi:hypothetical protein